MAMSPRKQICATRRKRLVHDRRKKIVDRRSIFYKHSVDEDMLEK
ncbi:MAG: hypothetical protein ACSHW0_12995 [Thalassotalea sp.]